MADYVSKYTGKQIDEAIGKTAEIKKVYNLWAYMEMSDSATSEEILAPFGSLEAFASAIQEVKDNKATLCLDSRPTADVNRRTSSHEYARISYDKRTLELRVTFDSLYPSFLEGVIIIVKANDGVASFKVDRYNKISSLNDEENGFIGGVCDNLNGDPYNTGVTNPILKTVLSANQGAILDDRLKVLEDKPEPEPTYKIGDFKYSGAFYEDPSWILCDGSVINSHLLGAGFKYLSINSLPTFYASGDTKPNLAGNTIPVNMYYYVKVSEDVMFRLGTWMDPNTDVSADPLTMYKNAFQTYEVSSDGVTWNVLENRKMWNEDKSCVEVTTRLFLTSKKELIGEYKEAYPLTNVNECHNVLRIKNISATYFDSEIIPVSTMEERPTADFEFQALDYGSDGYLAIVKSGDKLSMLKSTNDLRDWTYGSPAIQAWDTYNPDYAFYVKYIANKWLVQIGFALFAPTISQLDNSHILQGTISSHHILDAYLVPHTAKKIIIGTIGAVYTMIQNPNSDEWSIEEALVNGITSGDTISFFSNMGNPLSNIVITSTKKYAFFPMQMGTGTIDFVDKVLSNSQVFLFSGNLMIYELSKVLYYSCEMKLPDFDPANLNVNMYLKIS